MRTSLFPHHWVGFDSILDELAKASTIAESSYPPYNILKTGDSTFVIELAVAGFSQDDITIKVDGRKVLVTGKTPTTERTYLHKGIAGRSFERSFSLASNVNVVDADMENGMLIINLECIIPEKDKPKVIQIGSKQPALT